MKCGNCGHRHETVDEVRRCHGFTSRREAPAQASSRLSNQAAKPSSSQSECGPRSPSGKQKRFARILAEIKGGSPPKMCCSKHVSRYINRNKRYAPPRVRVSDRGWGRMRYLSKRSSNQRPRRIG